MCNNENVTCDEQCGDYKHFCPMWTTYEGEVITIVEDPSIIVSDIHPIYGIGIMYDNNDISSEGDDHV